MTMTINSATRSAYSALIEYLSDLERDEVALAALEEERALLEEREARAYAATYLATLDRDSAEYWDLYKEAYGIRPRW